MNCQQSSRFFKADVSSPTLADVVDDEEAALANLVVEPGNVFRSIILE